MKLRLRFALTTVAVTIPVIAGLGWIDVSLRERAGEEYLATITRGFMTPMEQARCEADAAAWMGRIPDDPRPPPTVYAVNEDFRPMHTGARALEASLVEAIGTGKPFGAARVTEGPGRLVEVLVPATRRGSCAYVLTVAPSVPKSIGLPPLRFWAFPVLAVFASMSLAMGPVVRRVRRLTAAVQRTARESYAGPIAIEGDDEIGELAQAFQAAAQQVRAQLTEKENRERTLRAFVSNTTHDVMTPLTVLQGHLASLAEMAEARQPVDPAKVTAAMTETHYMASLVHNLAAAAKLEAGEVEMVRAPVDLNALVDRVAGRHAPIARQLGVSLDRAVPEEPLLFEGDVVLLEQAVSNLVHNAVRYNRTGGHVAVILERPAGNIRLRVIDDGPGIAPEELTRIAERGYRGDAARTRAPDGQGLGLDIAFRVARAHALTLTLAPSEFGGLAAELREGA